MASLQTAISPRSWSLVSPQGASVGAAEVTVADDGVLIVIDRSRPERYQCGLEEYLTAVPLAGHSALRDIVRRNFSEADAEEIASEVKARLHGRPLRHVGEATPRQSHTGWGGVVGVLVLLALIMAGMAAGLWR